MEEQRHSRAGIASLVLSLVGAVGAVTTLVVYLLTSTQYGHQGLSSTRVALWGLGALASAAITLAALMLGIMGLGRKDRRRLFAILGTVLSAVAILTFVAMLVLRTVVD
jgi:Family of unknown function (DUF6142)